MPTGPWVGTASPTRGQSGTLHCPFTCPVSADCVCDCCPVGDSQGTDSRAPPHQAKQDTCTSPQFGAEMRIAVRKIRIRLCGS